MSSLIPKGETKEQLYSHLYNLVKHFLIDQILASSLSRNPSPANIRRLIENTQKVRNIEGMIENRIYNQEITEYRDIHREFWKHTSPLPRMLEEDEI